MSNFIKDELFCKAFRMRDEEPWLLLDENDIFHFLSKNGKDYYGMVTGFAGQHCALTIYEGIKGFSTRRYITDVDPEKARRDPFMLCSQSCLQVTIEDDKDQVPPETLKEERAYAKKHGFRLGHKNRYCAFLDYKEEYLPDEIEVKDEDILMEALDMLSSIMKALKDGKTKEELGFQQGFTCPNMEKKDGEVQFTTMPYPKYVEPEWPVGKADEFSIAAIKSHRKTFSVSMRITYIPMPTYDEEEVRPMIPAALLIISNKDGQIFPIMPEASFLRNPDAFLEGINEAFQTLDVYPKYINVDDDRTENFLRAFSKDTGIPLVRVHQIADMDEILDHFFQELQNLPDFNDDISEEEWAEEFGDDNQLAALIDALSAMEDEEIQSMPLDLKQGLLNLMETPLVPVDLKARLKRLL